MARSFAKEAGLAGGSGTGQIRDLSMYRPYDAGVDICAPLGLKKRSEWVAYCRGERGELPARPMDIPRDPPTVYREEFGERGGWGAWLGTGRIAFFNRKYRSYGQAMIFVHALGLKRRSDWGAYCRGERADLPAKPMDIPASPARVYEKEFSREGGWGAWLGTGTIAVFNREYRSYDQAVTFVHSLGLKRRSDWVAYCRGERTDLPAKPMNIPANPAGVYGKEFSREGGWGAWVGTAARKGGWRHYDQAVAFVRTLGLKDLKDWRAYCLGMRPDLPAKPMDIPKSPYHCYGDEFRKRGGMRAWLGTGSAPD